MKNLRINHLAIVVKDFKKSTKFYEKFLKLKRHKTVDSWYHLNNLQLLHIIEIDDAEIPTEDDMYHYYTHFALEVDSLKEVLKSALLLKLHVFQMDSEGEEHIVTSKDDDLMFGIKTLFIKDYDNNLWEFIQIGHSWELL